MEIKQYTNLNDLIKWAKKEIEMYQEFILKCQKLIVKEAKMSFNNEVKRFKKEELKKPLKSTNENKKSRK